MRPPRPSPAPLLAGVFGGDVHTLSARATLAPFVRMEQEHGSLITALMGRTLAASNPGPQPIFTTLRSGLGTLVDRITATLPPTSICRDTPVRALAREGGGWATRHCRGYRSLRCCHPGNARPREPGAACAARLPRPPTCSRSTPPPLSWLRCSSIPPWPFRVASAFSSRLTKALSPEPTLLAGTFMDQKVSPSRPGGRHLSARLLWRRGRSTHDPVVRRRHCSGRYGRVCARPLLWEHGASATGLFGRASLATLPAAI